MDLNNFSYEEKKNVVEFCLQQYMHAKDNAQREFWIGQAKDRYDKELVVYRQRGQFPDFRDFVRRLSNRRDLRHPNGDSGQPFSPRGPCNGPNNGPGWGRGPPRPPPPPSDSSSESDSSDGNDPGAGPSHAYDGPPPGDSDDESTTESDIGTASEDDLGQNNQSIKDNLDFDRFNTGCI